MRKFTLAGRGLVHPCYAIGPFGGPSCLQPPGFSIGDSPTLSTPWQSGGSRMVVVWYDPRPASLCPLWFQMAAPSQSLVITVLTVLTVLTGLISIVALMKPNHDSVGSEGARGRETLQARHRKKENTRMKYINRDLAFVTGILIALAGTAVPALAVTSITTCGFVISAPGNYVLNANLLNCTGDGIDVLASNVSVNLNGYIINAGSPSSFIGVNVGIPASPIRLNHVGIQGSGLIKNFVAGVNITRCDYCQVALVTSAQNANGMSADHVNYINVGSNVLVANTGAGLLLSESVNGVVAYNEISGNGSSCPGSTSLPGGGTSLVVCGQGLFIEDSSANTVNNNTLSGNLANGLWQDHESQFSRIYSNVTDGNAGVGILIDGSGGNGIFNNTSSRGNGTFDLQDTNFACGTNTWGSNVFFTSNPSTCIH